MARVLAGRNHGWYSMARTIAQGLLMMSHMAVRSARAAEKSSVLSRNVSGTPCMSNAADTLRPTYRQYAHLWSACVSSIPSWLSPWNAWYASTRPAQGWAVAFHPGSVRISCLALGSSISYSDSYV